MKGTLKLIVGGAGAQLLLLFFMPVISRLYSPDDFGVLASLSSVAAILLVICSLRFEVAIPTIKNQRLTYDLYKISILTTIGFSVLTLLGVILLLQLDFFHDYLNRFDGYIWVIPSLILIAGIFKVFFYLNLRDERYSLLSKVRFLQSFSSIIIQLTLYKFGVVGLILGFVGSQAAGLLSLKKNINEGFNPFPSKLRIFAVIKKFKTFPLFSTFSALLSSLGQNLPVIIIGYFYGVSAAGLYFMAFRLVSSPVSIVNNAISNVFLTRGAKLKAGRLKGYAVKAFFVLFIISTPFFILLYLFAFPVITFVLGEQWGLSGNIISEISLVLLSQFIVRPLINVFVINKREDLNLITQLLLFVVRIFSLVAFSLSNEITDMLFYYSLFTSITYLLVVLVVFWSLYHNEPAGDD